jgi:pimeloyl-ACP methyl ester carboxylesterase
VQRFENAGHFVHQEEPEIFNNMLIDWLGRNTPA